MIILPLQDHIPTVAGMSVVFLIFAALAVYVALMRPRILGEVWSHPVFLAAYVFVGVSGLLEFSSPLSRYDEIVRFTQMIVGAICVAVLCRDRSALSTGLYGYIAAALWVSVVLFLTSYGTLQGMGKAENFHEASKIRNEAFADKAVQANINALGFVCVQGAIVAFALSLSDRLKHRRIPLLGIATFCLVASFLPMSRAAALISLVSLGAMLYVYGAKQGKALIVVSVLGMAIYMVVPDAVWSRMAFSTEVKEGKMEGRAWLLTTAINRLPEYIVAGVGSGNFWKKWGFEKGFYKESTGSVYGAHNALLQVAIYWGILGLSTFLLIMWSVYRSIPFQCGRDELSLALFGIIVALGLWLLESHTFYDKWLAFGIGMLVGARERIWPTGIVSAVETEERTSFRTIFLGRHRI
ncbi:MAG: O-antigen ligase family protein [Nitrospira sp.]|nr:O-antigen ligase family protein [Nitrospira sp.]